MGLIRRIISTLFKSEDDRKRLNKVVIPSFVVHFFAAIIGLVLIFVMTRSLGSKQYGVYTYSMSVIFTLVNLATYGICMLTVKEAPSLLSKGKTEQWKGLHTWSFKLIFQICVALAVITAIFITISTFYLHIIKESTNTVPILLALFFIPFFGVMNYYSASLRGNYKVILALIPDNIVKPLFYLISVGVLFVFSIKLNVDKAVLINIISYGSAAIFAIVAFYKSAGFRNIEAEYDKKFWLKSLQSFFLLTVIISINSRVDILMLGYFKSSSQVGMYAAADMIASKLTIFLLILNQVSAPFISRMHSLEQKQKLQEVITKISRYVMLISFPLYLIIIIFSKWIMSFFGPDFADGQTALIIISTGQIINISFGPVGNFALMSGNQRLNIIFTVINIFINIIFNLILTPHLGLNGTAIATALALITWNAGMFITIQKKTGIRTWLLG